MSAETVAAPVVEQTDTDEQRHSHIVNCPPDKPSTAAWIAEAVTKRLPVTALCGYVWVPGRNPIGFPVCPTCVEMANLIVAEGL